MSEPFVFDPRCDACKTPYGAVPLGAAVSLRVRPLEAAAQDLRHGGVVVRWRRRDSPTAP